MWLINIKEYNFFLKYVFWQIILADYLQFQVLFWALYLLKIQCCLCVCSSGYECWYWSSYLPLGKKGNQHFAKC